MNREFQDSAKLERIRTENMALASNPQTSPKFIEHLMREREQEGQLEVELEDEGIEVEWQTPTSTEEVQDVLQNLGLRMSNSIDAHRKSS